MKIYWCRNHFATAAVGIGNGIQCWLAASGATKDLYPGECRMVEMHLVPPELQCPNCKFVYEVAT